MADISVLSKLLNGVQRGVDLSSNALVVSSIKIGTTPTELTEAILARLISLQNGSDLDATYHTHDTLYRTQTALSSTTTTSGASLIGVNGTPTNYSASAANAQKHLEGIDAALGARSVTATVFTVANNQSTPADVTGMILSGTTGEFVDYSITRYTSTDELVQLGTLSAIKRPNSGTWASSLSFDGDETAIEFSVETSGQVQYTTTNMSGTGYVGQISFRVRAGIASAKIVDYDNMSKTMTDLDGTIFKTVTWTDSNSKVRKTSVLSGGTSPTFTTRTISLYDVDGTTLLQTIVFDLTYSGNDLVSEVLQ